MDERGEVDHAVQSLHRLLSEAASVPGPPWALHIMVVATPAFLGPTLAHQCCSNDAPTAVDVVLTQGHFAR